MKDSLMIVWKKRGFQRQTWMLGAVAWALVLALTIGVSAQGGRKPCAHREDQGNRPARAGKG